MTENPNYIEGKTGSWELVIGLEVHAQVASKAKLFSGAATAYGADPNTQVAFLDAGMPGMLPTINERCVDQAIKTGLGLHGDIQTVSIFDRKNYFYADLPLGYQISQFHRPIVLGGYVDLDLKEGKTKRVQLTRLHLEQDAGKSIHDLHPKNSYIDLNRSGIALMEIVTEPDMRSIEEAQTFVKKLRSILRYLGTCDGNMDQGSLRADVNVSLRRPGDDLGTRAEVKNLNSIRFIGQAIECEVNRQMALLESGQDVPQETRLFDPDKGETRSMRSKEDAHDYRYFPCPDLLPLTLSGGRIQAIEETLPELPDNKKQRFMTEFGLSAYDGGILVAEKETANYYESAISALKGKDSKQGAKQLANWLISEVFGALNRSSQTIETMALKSQHLAELVDLIQDGTISGKIAKDVFAKLWETGKGPTALVEELGLQQVSDPKAIETAIEDILTNNPDKVEQYKSGKDKLFGFFVGQVMKAMKGKANPGVVNQVLKDKLGRA